MTKEQIIHYLSEHKETFREKYSVEKIGLFGSFARGEAGATSDIDLYVEMKPSLFDMVGLKQEIESDLHRDVDLIREHKNIKPLLREMIAKDLMYV